MNTWLIILVVWLVGVVLLYGLMFAYWHRKFPFIAKENYMGNMLVSIGMALFFPLTLISWIIFMWRYDSKEKVYFGFKFK